MHFNETVYSLPVTNEGRNIWDILWTCCLTIFLCCWTSVCVNLPPPGEGKLARFREKMNVAAFNIVGPDYVMLIAIGQWESARRSTQKFESITPPGKKWTQKHAFFADMGGYHFVTDDFQSIPINAEQLYFLVKKGFVDYPSEDESDIDDRNKRDGLARAITLVQVAVFLVNVVARYAKRLAVTSLEVTTLAFVFATLVTSLAWRHKPQDIHKPIYLRSKAKMSDILNSVGLTLNDQYSQTPLDFLDNEEWFLGILWESCRHVLRFFSANLLFRPVLTRPIKHWRSDIMKVLSQYVEFWTGILCIAYSGVFIAGWVAPFPSPTEHLLWKVSSGYMLAFPIFCGSIFYTVDLSIVRKVHEKGSWQSALLEQAQSWRGVMNSKLSPLSSTKGGRMRQARSLNNDRRSGLVLVALIFGIITCALYCIARIYVLTEDFVGLRSLPPSAYTSIAWVHYLPHS